jgi:kynurenine formamidase
MRAMTKPLPRYRDLPAVPGKPQKTAWGLFGEGDKIGMFNLQTPERIVAAAKLVKRGVMFAMNWELDKPNPPLFHRGALKHTVHHVVSTGHHSDDKLDNFFPQSSSQWDGLTHVGDFEHGFWGGVTVQELRESGYTKGLGVDEWARRGIAGRAIMLDVVAERARQGRPIDCAQDDKITVADIEATRVAAGIQYQPGDVWLIRSGWVGWYEQQSQATREALAADIYTMKLPGLECCEAMAEYIFDNHAAAVASDCPSLESWPPPNFFSPDGFLHHFLLGRFGVAIGEMFVLDALAADCAKDGVYEGFFTSAPLNIPGGTGTPPNALFMK